MISGTALEDLPKMHPRPPQYTPNVSALYGANRVAALYCGLKEAPNKIRGFWEHGWAPKHWQFHPDFLLGFPTSTLKHAWYWVARKDEEDYLRDCGYDNAKAVGLPIVYLPDTGIERKPDSLLVMPCHSLDSTAHRWNFDAYARTISEISRDFSEVTVCVHPSCWRKGYWVESFRKSGFNVIRGLGESAGSALERLQRLLSRFDCVTTNGFGSHIAYAAYCGAKVSIYGDYCEYEAADYQHEPLYVFNPTILTPAVEAYSESVVRRNFGEFFCHPLDAKRRVEWAKLQLGWHNKVSPSKMRKLFGWRLDTMAIERMREAAPERVKHWGRLAVRPDYRRKNAELTRLRRRPRFTHTVTPLLGQPFEVADRESFLSSYSDIFEKQVYRFDTTKPAPFIIDCGSNVGLSVLYFKSLYPNSRIIAFEPDPELFDLLGKNCQSFGLTGIQLVQKAVWSSETTLTFWQAGGEGGRVATDGDEGRMLQVPSARLRQFLSEEVDLLKIDIEGAETEVLRDCADHLETVNRLFVEYHSFASSRQTLDEIVSILNRAGFRLHIHTPRPAPHPFVERNVDSGMDFQANIFAFRS
ncbi:MAG TPA: FkbM family methyltransferase [Blastocatellia bacterium]|nr:FkbM family methyltransferase [Blastocatellia bacterium]